MSILTLLPTVLLQSVMRCCDVRDLLALSRSCRAALQAASAPFPWSLSTARLCSLQPDLAASLSRSLLRFAPATDLQWLAPQAYRPLSVSDIDRVCSLPRLRSLTACMLSDVDWSALLRRPCFSQLESLMFAMAEDDSSLADGSALVSLQRLSSFSLRGDCFSVTLALPRMIALTDLSLDMFGPAPDSIGACVSLVRLELGGVDLDSLPHALSPIQLALRSLTLWAPCMTAVSKASPEPWCLALGAPPALSHVTILNASASRFVLLSCSEFMHPSGPLRVLTVATGDDSATDLNDSVITALLARLPLLSRLEWELFEVVPGERGWLTEVRGRAVCGCDDPTTLHRFLDNARDKGQHFAKLDSRVVVVEPTHTPSPEEQESKLRARFSIIE